MGNIKRGMAIGMAMALVVSSANAYMGNAAAKPKLSRKNTEVKVGKSVTIKVKNASAKLKVSWKSSNSKVAKITGKVSKGRDAKAVVKGIKKGKAVITAKYKADKKAISLKCRVTVINDKKQDAVQATQYPQDTAATVTPTPEVVSTAVPTARPSVVPESTPTPVPTNTPEASEDMKKLLDGINIPYSNEIRGNITLPDTYEGASITWESSDTSVITDKETDGKAAGFVTRGDSEKYVVMTATVTKDGETAKKSINVWVAKAPEPISEVDYEGYLFGHFIGEGKADEEQIYFALSNNRLNFTDMNNSKPVLISEIGEKGVRDPYLYRSPEGDRFFLIATDLSIYHRGGWRTNAQGYSDASTTGSHSLVLWQSTDLVNWDEPTLIEVAPENAGMAWAPEMIYNDATGEYVIYFASSIMNPDTKMKEKRNAIYYVTTRDFVNFSEPALFIDNQTDGAPAGQSREIIDTTILKMGDTYYSVSKDGDNYEANGGIRIMKTKNLLDSDSWEKVLDLDELGLKMTGQKVNVLNNTTLEGPEIFELNKKDRTNPDVAEYIIMADQYGVSGGYLPLTTTDIEDTDNSANSWKILTKTDYSFDKLKKRHGTVLRITKEEYDRVSQAYKNK